MLSEYQSRINARISQKENFQVNQLLKTGKYQTKSDLVRSALESFLNKETEGTRQ
jgi:Arc/MetJ-type ribon-helix-helix transcriptional regulator